MNKMFKTNEEIDSWKELRLKQISKLTEDFITLRDGFLALKVYKLEDKNE